MFLGPSMVALFANTTLLNFLSTQLPAQKDPDGIFDQPFSKYYNYIVVGAGSAGSIIATRLSEDRTNVLLLEAGGSDLENEFTRIPLQWLRILRAKENWSFDTVPQKYSFMSEGSRKTKGHCGKVLGGTSSINAMYYIRGSRYDYDKWQKEGCTGWGYDDVLPYFKKSEDIQIPELINSYLQLTFIARAFEAENIKCAIQRMNHMRVFGKTSRSADVGFGVNICKLHHKSRGTVRLRSKNPIAPPLIDPQYLSHQDDVDSYVKGIHVISVLCPRVKINVHI
ncbi:unnamed protein product [Mytilus coruscus]|uniref:Glucose-methanol-choline oxidoreductase N-terminal domain-containing protein n=1 Tax=Mytilus coruscus TaxID=42192 RepID=A0A6J8BH58_MYTCO|nr:unnamed protein product [Mytilus coruscus]